MRNIFGVAQAARPNFPGASAEPCPLVAADPGRFPHLHLGYYDRFRAVFQDGGYRHLGDYELPDVRDCPVTLDAPTMLRFLSSPSGHITATYCHLLPRLGRRIRSLASDLANLQLDAPREFLDGLGMRHIVDLHTAFDDGSFLLTTNGPPAPPPPDAIEVARHPAIASPSMLLKAHRKRVSEIIRSGSGRTPVPILTEDDLLRMQSRLHAARADHEAARAALPRADRHAFSTHRAQRTA